MIRFGMALMEMIEQLTKGFIKATGRQPDNLEKLKIQQEAVQRFKDMNKVVDMEGNVIDTSKGIMGGKQIQDSPEFGSKIKKTYDEAKGPGKGQEMVDALKSPGAKKSYKIIEEQLGVKLYGDETFEEIMEIQKTGKHPRGEPKAEGGIMRLGFKDGMTRRTFLKILGGAMSIPIIGKFLKPMKVGKTVTKVPMIKTDDVAGKPEWFDALVNKVIVEGDDVTKKLATGERQTIHQKKLDDGSVVRVTEDTDQGAVRVEYESEKNVFGDDVQLEYKKPLPDEGAPDPKAEFTTAESGPVGRQVGPDDYDMDIDEVGGTSIRDLDSDVSKLKEYATGKKPTMKELVQNIKRRDKAARITDDPEAQSDAIVRRQGEMLDYDVPDDAFASGGIARMLGE